LSTPSPPIPRLHTPEEPDVSLRTQWYRACVEGTPLLEVLSAPGGVVEWLWARWRALEPAGIDVKSFAEIVCGYQREIWFWLAGERTWPQCCSGLVGRIDRRIPA
jgi:hypothetical protein